jgi:hypothetical protein
MGNRRVIYGSGSTSGCGEDAEKMGHNNGKVNEKETSRAVPGSLVYLRDHLSVMTPRKVPLGHWGQYFLSHPDLF